MNDSLDNEQISEERQIYFSKKCLWTVIESTALLLNLNPDNTNSFYKKNGNVKSKFKELNELIVDAIRGGEVNYLKITNRNPINIQDKYIYKIKVPSLMEWCKIKEITIPEKLEQLVTKYSIKTTDWKEKCQEATKQLTALKYKLKDTVSMDDKTVKTNNDVIVGIAIAFCSKTDNFNANQIEKRIKSFNGKYPANWKPPSKNTYLVQRKY